MKKSNVGLWVAAGGLGLVALYFVKRNPANPIGLSDFFRTIMPTSPTQEQIAANFARRSGGNPSAAGAYGYGATSTQPVYAGALAGLGSFVTGLFQGQKGPGNAPPPSRPQASASSGGGTSQPNPSNVVWGDPVDWADQGIITGDLVDFSYIGESGFDYSDSGMAGNDVVMGGYGDTSFDPFAGF